MLYNSFSRYLKDKFGCRVTRISVDPGFPCPHRKRGDSISGCSYCNEKGFSGTLGKGLSVQQQLSLGIKHRSRSGPGKYIAYFQNGTGTNAGIPRLKETYDVVRNFPEVVAMSISTRPDCVEDEKLDLIAHYRKGYDVCIEYGMQTAHDRTLDGINRGHTFSQTIDAIERTAKRDIKSAVHVILGLPGESRQDMLATAREVSRLPVWGVKIHVFHVLKGTSSERQFRAAEIDLLEREDYTGLVCDFLENIRKDQVILRLVSDARKDFLVAPLWINDKLSIIEEINDKLNSRGTFQGSSEGTLI